MYDIKYTFENNTVHLDPDAPENEDYMFVDNKRFETEENIFVYIGQYKDAEVRADIKSIDIRLLELRDIEHIEKLTDSKISVEAERKELLAERKRLADSLLKG